jgi:hypothetical protein
VTVTLRWVRYGGYGVGSSWRYLVSVDGSFWQSGPRVVQPGELDVVGAVVYDRVREGGCGAAVALGISVRAVERDPLFDDIGDGVSAVVLPCREEPTKTHISTLVPVYEFPQWWWQRLLRRRPRPALLQFLFDVTTQCVS